MLWHPIYGLEATVGKRTAMGYVILLPLRFLHTINLNGILRIACVDTLELECRDIPSPCQKLLQRGQEIIFDREKGQLFLVHNSIHRAMVR
jgi:hypothetical protein